MNLKHFRLVSCLLLSVPVITHAGLGGTVQTLDNEKQQMKVKAASSAVSEQGYTAHTLQLDSGTVVNEYADGSGLIFAVTWRGPVKPDLSEVLGSYFGEYQRAPTAGQLTKRQVVVNKPSLSIRSAGRMRAFFGKAFLPQAVPPGVNTDDLQ